MAKKKNTQATRSLSSQRYRKEENKEITGIWSLEEINKVREDHGLPPFERKIRKCLRCDIEFDGTFARMCSKCRTYVNNNDDNMHRMSYD